jgi:hypothetical protein
MNAVRREGFVSDGAECVAGAARAARHYDDEGVASPQPGWPQPHRLDAVERAQCSLQYFSSFTVQVQPSCSH